MYVCMYVFVSVETHGNLFYSVGYISILSLSSVQFVPVFTIGSFFMLPPVSFSCPFISF